MAMKTLNLKYFGVTILISTGHVTSSVTIGLGICGFLLVVHCNHASILHHCGDIRPKSYWVTTLTFWGHVTSSFT